MNPTIHLARPNITEAEIEAVVEVLRSPSLSLGPKVAEFEGLFARTCGTREAVAVSSGTAALHVVTRTLGLGSNDEVITTPFSFVASANCILYEGAKPVFVDVDGETWNLDPALLAAAITPKTRAILPVHVFGQPVDMDAIRKLADLRGLKIIEDSCEALGSRYRGRPAGSLGDAGVFGFYPNKQITTGEGGMITTDDAELASLARSLRNQGRDQMGGWLAHPRLGYNYRLSDINCVIGLIQLQRLPEIIAIRQRVANWYRNRLAETRGLGLQRVAPEVDVMSWFVFVVRLEDRYGEADRDAIMAGLREEGIQCSNYFAPIHLQPYFKDRYGYRPGDFPRCESLAARTIALPFHHQLTELDVDRVCGTLEKLMRRRPS